MKFIQQVEAIAKQNNSLVCVGLDSDISKIPGVFSSDPIPQFSFNKAIIDATHDLVCAYKPNPAFYEACGENGIRDLKLTCDYIKDRYPEIPIILDAKRADIGNTNTGYVTFAFDYLGADAITLHPYLGREAIGPFLDRKDKGCIILCRTSNPGAGEFQDLVVDGEPLYIKVARNVATSWNTNDNCLLVVGATYPSEMKQIRDIAPGMTFLVPGIGAQGGDVEKTVIAGKNAAEMGMIINSSRGIIFASSASDFADRAREETSILRDSINQYRKTGQ